MISWLIWDKDNNAYFAGSGSPPRHGDDWAALEVIRLIESFGLVSLSEEICPAKATRINSIGHKSCLNTFLVSRWLWESGRVSMYEVVDWIETGSDHCPIYLRVRVHPKWVKRSQPHTKRILKSSGLRSLRMSMINVASRPSVVSDIHLAFSSYGS